MPHPPRPTPPGLLHAGSPAFRWSCRSVEQIILFDGYQIVVTTDVPCHLWMRWSTNPPQYHTVPSLRRGVYMHGNRYFCFTVYRDNEQEEAGDTLIHTFIKHNWPHCETRYFYFIGERFGLPSPSNSPCFEKHFDQAKAPPLPEHMDELVSIEPQYLGFSAAGAWTEIDLTHAIHPDATGIIFCVINTDSGASREFGLRAKGSAHAWLADQKRYTQTWGLCPVSADRKIEYFSSFAGVHDLWIMGYTGPNVHFLEPPVDITPPGTSTWTEKDLSAHAPGAIAVILDLGNSADVTPGWGARCKGSTDNRTRGCGHVFPVIKCDEAQKIELYLWPAVAGISKAHLIGYITANVTMETDAPSMLLGARLNWVPVPITASYATPKFAFVEMDSTTGWVDFGAQKRYSLRNILYDGDNHNWAIVHCDDDFKIELYREHDVQGWWLHGVSH